MNEKIKVREIPKLMYKNIENDPRSLHLRKVYSCYDKLGCVYFTLVGSPGRFGIYIPGKRRLLLISSSGRVRVRSKVVITDLGDYPDNHVMGWS